MLTSHIEPLMPQIEELKTLFGAHYEELALNQDKVPLDPMWEVYEFKESRGETCYVTLRDGGQLIGYVVMFVAPGLHYRTCLTAHMDILFVRPDRRDATAKGVLLMLRTLERELRRRGVQRWFMGHKYHKDIGVIFRRIGMVPAESTYTKWLGE